MTSLVHCLLASYVAAMGMLAAPLQEQKTLALPAGASAVNQTWIGPEDTITIFALNAEEISKPWRVSASGELNLPMAGRIQAAGMTVEQLEQEITSRLDAYLNQPQVTVFVSEKRSHPVTVSGAVEKPGIVQMRGPMPLFEVLVLAGTSKEAGPFVTLTRRADQGVIPYPGARTDKDGASSIRLELKDVMQGYGREAELTVLAHDLISVEPGKRQRLVYISGEVNRPGAIELMTQDRVSISKIIAMAGGLTRTASPKKTMIRRINSKGIETSISFINLNRILSGKAKDVELGEGDVVVIPSDQLKGFMQSVSTSAVSTGIWILGTL
jgi:polysaccharide biosynthesis/export protein